MLIDGFHAYKEAFVEITKIEKFKVVAETEGFELNDYLLSLQPLLALARDNPTIDHLQSKYTVLHLKLKKQYENWPKELFSEWATRSKEKMKKF